MTDYNCSKLWHSRQYIHLCKFSIEIKIFFFFKKISSAIWNYFTFNIFGSLQNWCTTWILDIYIQNLVAAMRIIFCLHWVLIVMTKKPLLLCIKGMLMHVGDQILYSNSLSRCCDDILQMSKYCENQILIAYLSWKSTFTYGSSCTSTQLAQAGSTVFRNMIKHLCYCNLWKLPAAIENFVMFINTSQEWKKCFFF